MLQLKLLVALVAIGYFFAESTCRSWRSPLAFEHRDAAEPEVQQLLRLTERPDRGEQGFTALPVAGPIDLARQKRFPAPDPGWEQVAVSLFIQGRGPSRAWYFAKHDNGFEFLFETETFHSGHCVRAPTINSGKPFVESVELEYVTRTFSAWRRGYRVWRDGASGRETISLAEARALVETWRKTDKVARKSESGG